MIRVKLKDDDKSNWFEFENLVNYDKSKTYRRRFEYRLAFENLVNYDKSKTKI